MPQIRIEYADEPAQIVADLVETIDDHKPLEHANIVCLFTNQRMKDHERVTLGKATKQGAIAKFFASGDSALVEAGPDFVLIFSRAQWGILSHEKRVALVDHELMHCCQREKVSKGGKVTKTFGLRGHDIEEFQSIVKRHGFVFEDDQQFADVVQAKQLELDGADLKQKSAKDGVAADIEHAAKDVLDAKKQPATV